MATAEEYNAEAIEILEEVIEETQTATVGTAREEEIRNLMVAALVLADADQQRFATGEGLYDVCARYLKMQAESYGEFRRRRMT